jgi:hypothetical protein
MGVTGLTLSGFLVLAAAGPSAAAENTSAYTKLDLDKCRAQPTDPDDPVQTGIWLCSGYAGIKVRAEEADLRFYVSYGARADQEPAAHQTVPAFNTIGETVEWRLDGKQRPIATILRFHTGSDDTSAGSTLVVTRLGPPGGGLPRRLCRCGRQSAGERDCPRRRGQGRGRFQLRKGRGAFLRHRWRADPVVTDGVI